INALNSYPLLLMLLFKSTGELYELPFHSATYISSFPRPLGASIVRYRLLLSLSVGKNSSYSVLTGAPKFMGADQAEFFVSLVTYQISKSFFCDASSKGLSETKNKRLPSCVKKGSKYIKPSQ